MSVRRDSTSQSSFGRRRAVIGLLAVFLLVAASCGGDEDDSAQQTEKDPPPTSDSSGETVLDVADTDLGPVLVDGDGMTLYLFTNDRNGESTCEDACAETWPPLTARGEPRAADALDSSLVGTVPRADGSTQVTYADRPLYLYAPDQEAGDVTGHGVNDVWFAMTPQGEPAESSSTEASIGY